MIYILVFVAISLNALLVRNREAQKTFCLVWSAFFLGFIGFREWVGCDFGGYVALFDQFDGEDFPTIHENMELAYAALFTVTYKLGWSVHFINLVSALVFLGGLWAYARRQPDPLAIFALAFPVMLLHLAMSGIRQASALAFVMLALNAFVDRRRVMFAALIMAASLFHASAIALIPLVLTIGRKLSLVWLVPIVTVGCVALPLLAPGDIEIYQARYLQSDVTAFGALPRVGTVSLAAVLFYLGRKSWLRNWSGDYYLMSLLSIAMIALLPVTFVSSIIADRFAYYLMPAQLAIFGRLPYLRGSWLSSSYMRLAPFVLLGTGLLLWLYFSPLAALCYTPYRNYLFEWRLP